MSFANPQASYKQVTKIDAASNQLVTAIWLYFEDVDPISVHSLAFAASEILDRLAEHRGADSVRTDYLNLIVPERRQEVGKAFNAARNFFKHGSDPEGVFDRFSDTHNLFALVVACEGIHRLLGHNVPIEIKIFEVWLAAAEPDLIHLPQVSELDTGPESDSGPEPRKPEGVRPYAAAE